MTTDLQKLNKRVCRKLGIHWHEMRTVVCCTTTCFTCSCGKSHKYRHTMQDHVDRKNPDFIAHPEELLLEMAKRGDWPMFLSISGRDRTLNYILDTTEGKLAKAVDEFLNDGV